MRIYLDTEFADWDDPDTDLISIALVAEDGRELYAERTDFDLRKCTRFVRLNVLPLLGAPDVDYDGDWLLLAAARTRITHRPQRQQYLEASGQAETRGVLRARQCIRHQAMHDVRSVRNAGPQQG